MKKKIAYIVSRFPTISETFILYEIIELQKFGVEIDIFPLIHQKGSIVHTDVKTLTPRVHYTDYFSWSTIQAHWYWINKSPRTYVQTIWQAIAKNLRSIKFLSRALIVILLSAPVARRIESLDIERIHAHSATHPTLMAHMIWSLTGIPYSFTAHSSDIFFNQTMLSEKIAHASFVATISEYNRNFLHSTFPSIPAGKIRVIHCGIDPTKFPDKPLQRSSNSFNLICVARLEKIKGHQYLIEACAQLKAQNVDFQCYLVGDGELQSRIQEQINHLDLIRMVKILGYQPHQLVIKLLTQADVLVLPSISEGIPVAVMEGMAAGLPVVATAVTGVPELVEDGVSGFLVPPQNSTALTDALLKLYSSPQLRIELGQMGRKKVVREFNLQHSAETLYKAFQEA